jgi:hypothetical protein
MPYDVKEHRRADSLTRGARVILDDMPEVVLYVKSAERKAKYTYLELGASLDAPTSERLRYENVATLMTLREELTDAERLVRDYQRAQRWASEELAEGLARVPADELIKLANAWHSGTYKGHVLDWSDGTTFLKIQAKFKMWRTVQHTLDRLRELYGDDVTALSAVAVELDDRDRERLDYVPDDPTSRSTNVLSNLIDALDRWAWETLSDSARYHLTHQVREQEQARLVRLIEERKTTED